MTQVLPAEQTVRLLSHASPGITSVTPRQVLELVSHASPTFGSHPGPVWRLGSHAAPIELAVTWQVPAVIVAGLAPTHENPTPHGLSLSQLSPPLTEGAAHTVFWSTHRSPGPHVERLAQESPSL